MTNRNYRIRSSAGDWVLRIAADAELLGVNREAEYAAAVVAGGLGIGPTVLAYLPDERVLITRFVEGRAVSAAEMRQPAMLGRAARLLRRLHAGPPIDAEVSAFGEVELYRDSALKLGVELPGAFDRVWTQVQELRGPLEPPDSPSLCHTDLLNANFIDADDGLMLLDWEYAGMGDPVYDLANFSNNHGLDDAGDRELLKAYFGTFEERDFARLRLMRIMSDLQEATWTVAQLGLRTTEFDYEAYAAEAFAQLERRVADPRYCEWISLLSA